MSALFEVEEGENGIYFDNNGKLSAITYSYYIDSTGEFELTKEQTKKLFEVMKDFYKGSKS